MCAHTHPHIVFFSPPCTKYMQTHITLIFSLIVFHTCSLFSTHICASPLAPNWRSCPIITTLTWWIERIVCVTRSLTQTQWKPNFCKKNQKTTQLKAWCHPLHPSLLLCPRPLSMYTRKSQYKRDIFNQKRKNDGSINPSPNCNNAWLPVCMWDYICLHVGMKFVEVCLWKWDVMEMYGVSAEFCHGKCSILSRYNFEPV